MPASSSKLCPHCHWLVTIPALEDHERASCPRCGQLLITQRLHFESKILPWAIACFIAFLGIFPFEFLSFSTPSVSHTISFLDTYHVLIDYGYRPLAVFFLLSAAILPGLFALGAIYLTYSLNRHSLLPASLAVAKVLRLVDMWLMTDIFILGILISMIKIVALADVHFGPSFWMLAVFTPLFSKVFHTLEWPVIWQRLAGPAPDLHAELASIHSTATLGHCSMCKAAQNLHQHKCCPRCGHTHWLRNISRLQLTWALLVSALLLYIPANLYPIMTTTSLAKSTDQTIASGVLELIAIGSWPIALVIFVASIFIPLVKIFALGWLCTCVHYGWTRERATLDRIYRVIEWIGRWSMLDVFVVAVSVALVQAGFFMSVSPGPAIMPFAMVVVLTLFATKTFNTHWLWQNCSEH